MNNQKRTAYRIIAPSAVIAIIIVTLLEIPRVELGAFDFISRGLMAIAYAAVSYLLWFKQDAVSVFERLMFIVVAVFYASQFYAMVYDLQFSGASFLLMTVPPWLSVVYFWAYFTFELRRALAASLMFYCVILIPGLLYIVLNGNTIYSSGIINIYISNVVYIFSIYGIWRQFLRYARIEALKEQAEKENEILKAIAERDGLTNVANRRKIDEVIAFTQHFAAREKVSVAVLMIDLDNFKAYNDTYGHLAGDELLKAAASTMRDVLLRTTDFFGRFGGEEFIAILPFTDVAGAAIIADKIRQAVFDLSVAHCGTAAGVATVSIGLAIGIPTERIPINIFIDQADQALYRAKQLGKNRIEC